MFCWRPGGTHCAVRAVRSSLVGTEVLDFLHSFHPVLICDRGRGGDLLMRRTHIPQRSVPSRSPACACVLLKSKLNQQLANRKQEAECRLRVRFRSGKTHLVNLSEAVKSLMWSRRSSDHDELHDGCVDSLSSSIWMLQMQQLQPQLQCRD